MIDDEKLYRLDEILAENGGEDSMIEAAEVHGILSALEVSQQKMSESTLNEIIWGSPEVNWLNDKEKSDYEAILDEIKLEIRHGLEAGEFLPVFAEFESEEGEQMIDVEVWCESFCMAIGADEEAWAKPLQEEHQGLNIICLFGTEDGHEVLNITPEEELENFAKAIAPSTADLYKFFRTS
jgi:uncharacterized protein